MGKYPLTEANTHGKGDLVYRILDGPQGARVELDGREVINFASNNYLGLANSDLVVKTTIEGIKKYGVGPGASRNIVGNYRVHEELERELAKFKDVEKTLVFNSGVSANVGSIPVVAVEGDVIFSDELNHGSLIDGCRLSKAQTRIFPHMDTVVLEEMLQEPMDGEKFIMTDAVFSMDGDVANLPKLFELGEKYGAKLIVDDAHGDGVMGPYGKGTLAHFGLEGSAYLETGSLSKGFGVVGGFVGGSEELINKIRREARSFIFTASPLPQALAMALYEVIKYLGQDDTLVKKLWENRSYFVEELRKRDYDLGQTKTPIVPVMIGNEEKAKAFSAKLFDEGVYAQAITFPLVPRGKARLRMIVTADHTRKDLDETITALEKLKTEI